MILSEIIIITMMHEDNYDDIAVHLATIECPSGYRKCPNNTRCIPESFFCDNDNDCGDYSDESREICGKQLCICFRMQ